MALRGEVVLRVAVARRRGHRAHVAGLRVDGDDRARAVGGAEVAVQRPARELLQVQVDRRVDAQAAAADGVEAVLVDQVLLDVVEDVALALGRVVAVVLDAEAHPHRLGGQGLGDVALVGHALQHVVAPRGGGALVEERVVVGGRLRQTGQQRRLAQRQPRGRLVEEDARRGLDADRRLAAHGAVGHRVDVLVDDPQLAGAAGMAVLELLGQLGLADLALVAGHAVPRALARVEVAHELHGQRRAALDVLLGLEVLDRGADDALEVHALVLVEAPVLDGDRRLADDVGDLVGVHRRAQDVGVDEAQPGLAVGRVDARGRPELDRLLRRQRRRAVGDVDDPRHRRDPRDGHAGHDQSEEHEDDATRAALVATPAALALSSRHQEPWKGRSGFVATPPTPCFAQCPQDICPKLPFARDALGRRHGRPGDLQAQARVGHLGDARRPGLLERLRRPPAPPSRRRRAPARPRPRAPRSASGSSRCAGPRRPGARWG